MKQKDAMDCGPTCLAMVAGHYGRHPDRDMLRELCDLGKDGVFPLTSSRWCLKKLNTKPTESKDIYCLKNRLDSIG